MMGRVSQPGSLKEGCPVFLAELLDSWAEGQILHQGGPLDPPVKFQLAYFVGKLWSLYILNDPPGLLSGVFG